MKELFLNVLSISLSASWLILAVLLARMILKKAPKWIFVMLWGVVAFRLICPFSLESIFSLIPESIGSGEALTEWKNDYIGDVEIIYEDTKVYQEAVEAGNEPIRDEYGGYYVVTQEDKVSKPLTIEEAVIPVLSYIWLIGMTALLLYSIISSYRLYKKIETAILYRDNIYQSENISSPFLFGILKPRIYLPFHMNEENIEYVIAHEEAHLNRMDHLWKLLGFVLLAIHWFNPLIWLGFVLLCRDMELACDEKVIKDLSNEERADYSQALLSCSVHNQSILACPVAFGEIGVKDRIKSIFSYEKPTGIRILLAILLCLILVLCFLTVPKKNKLYTHKELAEMPAMELLDLFLDKGLELPEFYKELEREEVAEYLDNNLETLSQGIVMLSYTAHWDFAKSVQQVYDKITYPPGTEMIKAWKYGGEHTDSGYEVKINASKIPLSNIKGEIRKIKNVIRKNYKNQEPTSSVHPGYWYKEFATPLEAAQYIGLSNLRSVDWKYNTKGANIEVVGNKKGEIETICLMSFYEKDSVRMQTRATVYTDKYMGEMKTGLVTTEPLEFYDNYVSTNQNVLYHIVGSNKKENGTFKYVNDVYLVLDNILYRLNLVFEQEDMGTAQDLMEEWANRLEGSYSPIPFLPDNYFDESGYGENTFANFCLSSYYDSPEDVDLEELFYNGFHLDIDETDRRFLLEQNIELDSDIVKVHIDDMNVVLKQYFNLTLDETNKVGMEKFIYNEETGYYYLIHNDVHQRKIHMKEQRVDEIGNYYLIYTVGDETEESIAVLRKEKGRYIFLSNKKLSE